jgi:hypothetical protein
MFGDTPRVKAFRGEQELTSALLQLTEDKETKIGTITGHGEPALGQDPSLSRFKEYVQRQNIVLEPITLANQETISTDYAAIVLADPRYDLTDRDLTLLRTYWNDQGRLFILLDPNFKTPKLDQFLAEFGVHPDDDVIVVQEKTGIEEQSQSFELSGQFLSDASFLRPLNQAIGLFPGGTRSLTLNSTTTSTNNIVATKALVPSASEYWGETDNILHTQAPAVYNQGVDLPPPLVFGVALQKGTIKDARVQVRSSSRMLVIGNADFIRDEVLAQSPADVDFILLSINWLADREKLLAIAPKELRSFTLNLSELQMDQIVLITVAGIPLLVGLLGLGVWVVRRR